MYIKEAGGGEESVPELGVVIRGDSHLHIDRIWSTYNRVPGPPPPILFNTHLHTTTLGRKTTGNVFAPCWTFSLQSWSVGAMVTLVAHLLWQLMGVEDAGHRHLELVFFFLGLAQSCLSLLQEEVWRVLTSKLLQDHTSRRFGNLDSFGCVVLLKPYSFNTNAFKFNSSTLKFYSSTKKQVSAVFSLMNNIFMLM